MKRISAYITCFTMLLSIASAASAQPSKITVKSFEGVWQVSMQKSPAGGNKFMPTQTNDLKIFDANGRFRHILYSKDRYIELSRGKMEITSDSTYTEHLEKHLAFGNPKVAGKVKFKFLDTNTFMLQWHINESSGEEMYERV